MSFILYLNKKLCYSVIKACMNDESPLVSHHFQSFKTFSQLSLFGSRFYFLFEFSIIKDFWTFNCFAVSQSFYYSWWSVNHSNKIMNCMTVNHSFEDPQSLITFNHLWMIRYQLVDCMAFSQSIKIIITFNHPGEFNCHSIKTFPQSII